MTDPSITTAIITRFVPSYRVPVIRALNKRLGGTLGLASGSPPKESSLTLLTPNIEELDEFVATVRLTNHWLRGEDLYWQSFRHIFKQWPSLKTIIVEENPRSLSIWPLMRAARRKGINMILWGHFSSNHRSLSNAGWRNRMRLGIASRADALITYTDHIADSLRELLPGAPVFAARNTLDTDLLFPIGDRLMEHGRTAIRTELGLPDEPTLLFIGRLIPAKGVENVLHIADRLREQHGIRPSVVIIGDGPERKRISELAHELNLDVVIKGAMPDLEESAAWIAASDVLVNPGYLGLSVNHAFSLGVPIVAPAPGLDAPGHSPEWAYVKDGENGVFARDSSLESLTQATWDVLQDAQAYSTRAAVFARDHLSIHIMVDGLIQAIEHVDSPE